MQYHLLFKKYKIPHALNMVLLTKVCLCFQIKYLRLIFDAMGLPQPKIGTVEEFQGQERPIILITTVRSTESLIQQDMKYTLGFVNSPKRLNVAITRAQISMILFCNPHLLCTDLLWNEVIMDAVNNNKYMGCYFPIDEK